MAVAEVSIRGEVSGPGRVDRVELIRKHWCFPVKRLEWMRYRMIERDVQFQWMAKFIHLA